MIDLPVSVRQQPWIMAFSFFFMPAPESTKVNTARPSTAARHGSSPQSRHNVPIASVQAGAVMPPSSGWLDNRPQRQAILLDIGCCIAAIITLPALIFARVPRNTTPNAVIARRTRSPS